MVFQVTKIVPFEFNEMVFRKDRFLALFSFPDLPVFHCPELPRAAHFMLTTWPFGTSPRDPYCGGGYARNSDSTGALVSSSQSEKM